MSHITSLQRKKRPILEFIKYLDVTCRLSSKNLQYNRRFYIKGVGGLNLLNLRGGALEDPGSAGGKVGGWEGGPNSCHQLQAQCLGRTSGMFGCCRALQ